MEIIANLNAVKHVTTICVIGTPGDAKNATWSIVHRLLNVVTQVLCNTRCTEACHIWKHAGFGIHILVLGYIISAVECSVCYFNVSLMYSEFSNVT